uniref:Uncharacterized protein n=1 Tax=Meloidogyne enterolobii TaxID=390850 RepID=A0A6V7UHR6_MELEN|nr:unnamed protein product [Meloidogyne enterolobii]
MNKIISRWNADMFWIWLQWKMLNLGESLELIYFNDGFIEANFQQLDWHRKQVKN